MLRPAGATALPSLGASSELSTEDAMARQNCITLPKDQDCVVIGPSFRYVPSITVEDQDSMAWALRLFSGYTGLLVIRNTDY